MIRKQIRVFLMELDNRGVDASKRDKMNKISGITEIMMKGRKEIRKQQLFKCRIDKIEFQMSYFTTRIKEINDELKELHKNDNAYLPLKSILISRTDTGLKL